MTFKQRQQRVIITIFLGVIAMAILSVFSATLGAADISFANALRIMLNKLPIIGKRFDITDILASHQSIVLNLRLPRILLALMVGGMLASAGTVYQSVFRNPMADPFVLGISSGAALGAALAMIVGFEVGLLGLSSISVSAFIGALITTFVVYRVATAGRKTPVLTLVLTGIAISFLLSALLSLIITFNRDQLEQIVFWMYGSLGTVGWHHVIIVLPVFTLTTLFIVLKGNVLNIMTLGEDSAQTLGVDVQRERLWLLSIASLSTAAAVSVTGIVGFVGLVVPHVIRLISGPDNRSLLPYTILAGGVFMMVSDAVARTAVPPMEIPIGIITSLVGAPYFIYLIIKNKKGGGY